MFSKAILSARGLIRPNIFIWGSIKKKWGGGSGIILKDISIDVMLLGL